MGQWGHSGGVRLTCTAFGAVVLEGLVSRLILDVSLRCSWAYLLLGSRKGEETLTSWQLELSEGTDSRRRES